MIIWLLRIFIAAMVIAFAVGVWQHRDNPPTGNGLPKKTEQTQQ